MPLLFLGGKLGHKAQRNRKRFQLKVGPEKSDGVVSARLTWYFRHFDSRVAQRELGLQILRGHVIKQDVFRDPGIQKALALVARHEAANLVAHHGFKEMREPRDGEN